MIPMLNPQDYCTRQQMDTALTCIMSFLLSFLEISLLESDSEIANFSKFRE